MKLNTKGFGAVVVVLAILLVGAVGAISYGVLRSSKNSPTPAEQQKPAPTPVANEEKPTGTVVTTGDSQFGPMLFNDKGQAIYIWELETSAKPECYGNCAELWPPVLTDGSPQAAGSVNAQLLGTTERSDGSTQVTYNGHPLYYYAHEGPGEVKCHNIRTHGGLWWVVQPDGNRAA